MHCATHRPVSRSTTLLLRDHKRIAMRMRRFVGRLKGLAYEPRLKLAAVPDISGDVKAVMPSVSNESESRTSQQLVNSIRRTFYGYCQHLISLKRKRVEHALLRSFNI